MNAEPMDVGGIDCPCGRSFTNLIKAYDHMEECDDSS